MSCRSGHHVSLLILKLHVPSRFLGSSAELNGLARVLLVLDRRNQVPG